MLMSVQIVNGKTDGRTENRTPISHLARAGATNIKDKQKGTNNNEATPWHVAWNLAARRLSYFSCG